MSEYHVTRIDRDGELYGHETTCCDAAGCAGNESRLGRLDESNVTTEDGENYAQHTGGNVYHLPNTTPFGRTWE